METRVQAIGRGPWPALMRLERQGPQDPGCVAASLSPQPAWLRCPDTCQPLPGGNSALADEACPRGGDVTAFWPGTCLIESNGQPVLVVGQEEQAAPDSRGRRAEMHHMLVSQVPDLSPFPGLSTHRGAVSGLASMSARRPGARKPSGFASEAFRRTRCREEDPLSEQVSRCLGWQVFQIEMSPWKMSPRRLVGGSPAVPTLAGGSSRSSAHRGLTGPGHGLWASCPSRGGVTPVLHTHLQSCITPCYFRPCPFSLCCLA